MTTALYTVSEKTPDWLSLAGGRGGVGLLRTTAMDVVLTVKIRGSLQQDKDPPGDSSRARADLTTIESLPDLRAQSVGEGSRAIVQSLTQWFLGSASGPPVLALYLPDCKDQRQKQEFCGEMDDQVTGGKTPGLKGAVLLEPSVFSSSDMCQVPRPYMKTKGARMFCRREGGSCQHWVPLRWHRKGHHTEVVPGAEQGLRAYYSIHCGPIRQADNFHLQINR